jgi:hypothetical protein
MGLILVHVFTCMFFVVTGALVLFCIFMDFPPARKSINDRRRTRSETLTNDACHDKQRTRGEGDTPRHTKRVRCNSIMIA